MRSESVLADISGRFAQKRRHVIACRDMRRADVRPIEPVADSADRLHLDALRKPRLATYEKGEPRAERIREGLRVRGQQDSRISVCASEEHRPVEGHDRLPRAGRA